MKQLSFAVDDDLVDILAEIAEGTGKSIEQVITGILVKWVAELHSNINADPLVRDRTPLHEFTPAESSFDLYRMLRSMYDREHRKQWEQVTEQMHRDGATLSSKQKEYIAELQERWDRERDRMGAMKKVQDLKDRGLIDNDVYGPSETILRLWEAFQADDITEAEYLKRTRHYKRNRRDDRED